MATLVSRPVQPASVGVVSPSFVHAGCLMVKLQFQTAAWDFDNWDFAGDMDDGFIMDRIDTGNPMVLFGPVPSLQEARDATSELKDALKK